MTYIDNKTATGKSLKKVGKVCYAIMVKPILLVFQK